MSVFKKYISQNEGAQDAPSNAVSSHTVSPTREQYKQTQGSMNQSPEPTTPKPSSTSQIAAGSGRNMLSSDVEIKGRVKFSNDLVVDGKIDGEIDSDGSLTVGENARVRAEIRTRSVVIYGKVHGNITVTDRVEIKANAELIGDIKAATLSIEAGAIFVGKSTVGASSATAADTSDAATDKNAAQASNAQQPKKPSVATA